MAKEAIADKIFDALSKGPTSMNALSRKTGLHPRTVIRCSEPSPIGRACPSNAKHAGTAAPNESSATSR